MLKKRSRRDLSYPQFVALSHSKYVVLVVGIMSGLSNYSAQQINPSDAAV